MADMVSWAKGLAKKEGANMENIRKSTEEVVVEYIRGVRACPPYMVRLVREYNKRAAVADTSEAYPRIVDEDMDKLYDAMVVLARSC